MSEKLHQVSITDTMVILFSFACATDPTAHLSISYIPFLSSLVLHYCMGGIRIDKEGNVLNENDEVIPGLHAAGEVTGGVHGQNRLGGNSLLECTVFGTIVGQKIPVKSSPSSPSVSNTRLQALEAKQVELPTMTLEELAEHNTKEDLWVAVHGIVYDFTDFADEHPAGAQSIIDLAGTDGTAAFAAVHNMNLLEDFEEDKKGILSSNVDVTSPTADSA